MMLVQLGLLGVGVALGLFLSRRARAASIPLLFGFGLLLGQERLGLVQDDAFLQSATEIGLLLMLFYTSLFGNPRAIKEGGRIGLPLAAYDLIVNFAVAWWIGDYLGWAVRERLFLAGIIATSSTAVVLKVLGDEGRITRREGNVLVSLLLIEDWVFLGFYAFLGVRYGGYEPRSAPALLIGIVAFGLFLVALRMLRNALWSIRSRELLVAVLTSVGILGAFLGMSAGLPGVGAAFTTGLVLSGDHGARFSQREAPYLRDASAALFFVGYAALLAPTLNLQVLPLLGLALGGIVVTELVFLPVLARRLGLGRSESFVAGALLLPRGGKSAAFGKLYANAPGPSALFALAGLLAVVLTPLAPLLTRVGIALGGRRRGLPYSSPSEVFSRSARTLLMPTAYTPRPGSSVARRIVVAELLLLESLLGILTVAAPSPYSWVAGALLLAGLAPLFLMLRSWVRRAPGSPLVTHPMQVPRHHNRAFEHLPLLLTAPLALLLALAVLSPWAHLGYPIALGAIWLGALVVPWLRPTRRRAPPLPQALGIGTVFR